ncbi:MAG: methyl-accepting chemotaxis protein [Agathobaculum desmolans]|uniref:methyl-accepting chemotaxis protein n=1 Tax=Agathobaculum desmolans TaxID=39484 RepID=UPI0039931E9D
MKRTKAKTRSIKAKILISMVLTLAISLITVGGIACLLNYRGTQSTLEASMEELAVVAADRVSYQLQVYQLIAGDTGNISRLSDPEISLEEKKALLQQKVEDNDFQRYNLLDTQGHSLIDGGTYSDRAYFKAAMQGNTYVSEPLISAVTGEMTIIVAAPVWQDGVEGGQIAGVVYFVPHETFLNDIVSTLRVSEGGSAYMLDATGNTIAHRDLETVRNQENTIENAKSDPSLTDLAAIETDMVAGGTGFSQYSYGGDQKFTAYAPVPKTNGWSIAINAPTSDFTGPAIQGIIATIVLLIVAIIAASIVAVKLAVGIGGAIKACSNRLQLLSQGNLEAPVPDFDRNDEVGELVSSTKIIVTGLSTILKDIDYLLSQMGEGNFVVDSQTPELYIGDFAPLLDSIRRIKHKLSDVLSQIHMSSDQIAAGASQVSDGAQALAQGATEQASSVQELASTVHDISQNVSETADVSRMSQSRAEEAGGQVVRSNEMMVQMTTAMEEITEFSKQIGHIITTIEDIAFQTNILALNAAVEAARAGAAGKGFAVVADEVRSLASKSDQAAKATKELIENSVRSVQNGNVIVANVTDSLQKTTELAGLAVGDMVKVAEMVNTIAAAVAQVTVGLDQIAAVVQTNSATSEQSAAASEELSSQAQLLNDLAGQFRLPDNGYSYGD